MTFKDLGVSLCFCNTSWQLGPLANDAVLFNLPKNANDIVMLISWGFSKGSDRQTNRLNI
eukprot:scaffold528641_cov32-Prasinocladus_malaysianus.AAC.1